MHAACRVFACCVDQQVWRPAGATLEAVVALLVPGLIRSGLLHSAFWLLLWSCCHRGFRVCWQGSCFLRVLCAVCSMHWLGVSGLGLAGRRPVACCCCVAGAGHVRGGSRLCWPRCSHSLAHTLLGSCWCKPPSLPWWPAEQPWWLVCVPFSFLLFGDPVRLLFVAHLQQVQAALARHAAAVFVGYPATAQQCMRCILLLSVCLPAWWRFWGAARLGHTTQSVT